MDITQEDLERGNVSIAPSIFFNDIFSMLEEQLKDDVDTIVFSKSWRQIIITLHLLPGKTHDYIKKQAKPVIDKINEKYDCEPDISAYMRDWNTKNVEMYISYWRYV